MLFISTHYKYTNKGKVDMGYSPYDFNYLSEHI